MEKVKKGMSKYRALLKLSTEPPLTTNDQRPTNDHLRPTNQ